MSNKLNIPAQAGIQSKKILDSRFRGSVLVHLHVFYPDQAEYFAKKLANINGVDADFFITAPKEVLPALKPLLKFNPEVKVVGNKGYDILPFIEVLNNANLKNYDYILKLHTKRTTGLDTIIGGWYPTGSWWRDLLVDALIGSPEIFRANIARFKADEKLGMIASRYLIHTEPVSRIKITAHGGLPAFMNGEKMITCVAGTMFLVRAKLMQKFKDWGFTEKHFIVNEAHTHGGTFAHMGERLLCYSATSQGYKLEGFGRNRKFEILSYLGRVRRVIFQTRITRNGKRMIKILKIPVWNMKVKGGKK